MIELDGSFGEGGGQILRSSLTLALLTGKPFHLRKIRAGRAKPGLQAQHLMSVQASQKISNAQVRGAQLGSLDLVFEPGPVASGNFHFPISTAGATALVLQTIFLPLAKAGQPSTVTIEGGTHGIAAPCFHFLESTWRGYLQSLGFDFSLTMQRPGFYPRGGGSIQAIIQPVGEVRPLVWQVPPPIAEVRVRSIVAGLPEDIAERQAKRVQHRLKRLKLRAEITEESWPGGPGTVVLLEVPTPVPTLFFGLGERGKSAESVADEAVDQLQTYLAKTPLAVDPHSADQLLLPLALSKDASEYPVSEVTMHLITNVEVLRQFLDRELACEGNLGKRGRVRVE